MTAHALLWFAEKFVSLLIEQHRGASASLTKLCCDLLKNSYLCLLNNTTLRAERQLGVVVICWKIRIFAYWTTPFHLFFGCIFKLWFAEKFVSLLIEQHQYFFIFIIESRCDLLKNSYLCLLNNTTCVKWKSLQTVVICWKIRIFAYWTTPNLCWISNWTLLWFAEKFVSLLIEQHRMLDWYARRMGCDLLKNSYLCLLNNTSFYITRTV